MRIEARISYRRPRPSERGVFTTVQLAARVLAAASIYAPMLSTIQEQKAAILSKTSFGFVVLSEPKSG